MYEKWANAWSVANMVSPGLGASPSLSFPVYFTMASMGPHGRSSVAIKWGYSRCSNSRCFLFINSPIKAFLRLKWKPHRKNETWLITRVYSHSRGNGCFFSRASSTKAERKVSPINRFSYSASNIILFSDSVKPSEHWVITYSCPWNRACQIVRLEISTWDLVLMIRT